VRDFPEAAHLGSSQFPFTLARPEVLDYSKERFPLTFKALHDVLVLPWNERYRDEHLEYIAESIQESVEQLSI